MAAAFDPSTSEVVLFGGHDRLAYGDTWSWNGSRWTQYSSSTAPAPRWDAAMAFDEARGNVVLYGGRSASTTFSDTWVLGPAGWASWTLSSAHERAKPVLRIPPG